VSFETYSRRDFQVLIVDRDDARREQMLDLLTELGFGGVQIAAAPDSAASFADAQPPHIAMIAVEPIVEARLTIQKIRAVSSEIQILLHSDESDLTSLQRARTLAKELLDGPESGPKVWDFWSFPAESENFDLRRQAVDLVLDRACRRLYYQFETESWKERWEKGAPKNTKDPVAVRDRLFTSLQEFARVRDLDSVISTAVSAFSRVIENKSVIYMRWVPIRSSFMVQQMSGVLEPRLRGLGFPVHSIDSLRDVGRLAPMKEFVRDVFMADEFTALLHGTPSDPTGLFIFLGSLIAPGDKDEFEAVSFLFDLTWSRLEAVRDRHALERVDRGTGLPNKKALRETADFECMRARRLRHPLSVAAIEIGETSPLDLEAKLGTSYEAVLKVAGATLRRALRGTDYVARIERGRFAVLMPHTSVAEAVGVIDRMCRLIERLQLPALDAAGITKMKARAGVSEYPRLSVDTDGLLNSTDEALTAAWAALGGETIGGASGGRALGDGGIRVMVSAVSPSFQPDFEPILGSGGT
jgi:diguanylate cyclase (GGDEF)-like protein